MTTQTYEQAAKTRVDAKVARNAERLIRRYSNNSDSRRTIQDREKFLRGRAMGR
jgi:hypothetical protein